MKVVRVLVALAVALTAATLSGTPAWAHDDAIDELIRQNPGATRTSMIESLNRYAAEHGTTYAVARDVALREGRSHRLGGMRSSSGGGGKKWVTLGEPTGPGDIFVTAGETLFVQHGHAGIYSSWDVVVEAPGLNQRSRSIHISKKRVEQGKTYKLWIGIAVSEREKAARYAFDHLRGRVYNVNFWDNKDNRGPVNCSQLVWLSYKLSSNTDIDGNGGSGVYPYDFEHSPLAHRFGDQ